MASYILRMNIAKVGEQKGKRQRLFDNETFDELTEPGFKFILFASHPSREASIGLPIFEGLQEFNRVNNLNNFEYHLRSKETMKAHWTPAYMQERIGDPSKVIKAFVATGQAQEEELIKLVVGSGIPKGMITIL